MGSWLPSRSKSGRTSSPKPVQYSKMPIVDENQGGVRRYAIFTFVIDDQNGAPGSPASRFPQSPHASSLEASTRLRHCESFFMKRLKGLEKGFAFPFVDVSFFSSYQNIEEMKRLLEPRDCVNFHDRDIQLQKGCYEEVQLVDPKRDMIVTPIDDDHEIDHGSEFGSVDATTNGIKSTPTVVHPPGIQAGKDDYKKTRGYIIIAYKTMEYMYSRDFLSSWKTWTGVRYICMQMPRQLGLRRIAFYRQLSSTSEFSYVLLVEVTNLLLYAAQTLNLLNRIKLRLCGSVGVFREMDFQVDLVTANIHHLSTTYKPPISKLRRLDSIESLVSGGQSSIKGSQPNLAEDKEQKKLADASKHEASSRRRVFVEVPKEAKKRNSLVPSDYPPPSIPEIALDPFSSASASNGVELERKRAPRAESEDLEGVDAPTVRKPNQTGITFQSQLGAPVQHPTLQKEAPIQFQSQRPAYHTMVPVHRMQTSTEFSVPVPQPHPYLAHYQVEAPLQAMYGHILSHPIDTIMQNHQALEDAIASDFYKFSTYFGEPVEGDFGFAQLGVQANESILLDQYNSPVYSRDEWKKASAVYGGRQSGEEFKNLAQQFRTLRETPIIGSDRYFGSSGIDERRLDAGRFHSHADERIQGDRLGNRRDRSQNQPDRGNGLKRRDDRLHNRNEQVDRRDHLQSDQPQDRADQSINQTDRFLGEHLIDEIAGELQSAGRERSRSAAFLEDRRKIDDHTRPLHRKSEQIDNFGVISDKLQDKEGKIVQEETLREKLLDAQRLEKKILEADQKSKLFELEKSHKEPERARKKKIDQKSQKLDPTVGAATLPKRRQLPQLPAEATLVDEQIVKSDQRKNRLIDRDIDQKSLPRSIQVQEKKQLLETPQPQPQRSRSKSAAEKPKKEIAESSDGDRAKAPAVTLAKRRDNGKDAISILPDHNRSEKSKERSREKNSNGEHPNLEGPSTSAISPNAKSKSSPKPVIKNSDRQLTPKHENGQKNRPSPKKLK